MEKGRVKKQVSFYVNENTLKNIKRKADINKLSFSDYLIQCFYKSNNINKENIQ